MALVRTVFAITAFAHLLLAQAGAQSGASISGRITNNVTSAGIAGVTVQLCRSAGVPGQVVINSCSASATSDDTGAFHLAGIPDGQYVVMPVPKEGFFPVLPRQGSINVSVDTRFDLQM